jgi:S-adenosyl methyltransferase
MVQFPPVGSDREPFATPTQRPFDMSVAHPARMHNYLLGGKDNFAVDRAVADRRLEVFPDWRTSAEENRRFLARAVRFLVAEAGVRQFLDIGLDPSERFDLS